MQGKGLVAVLIGLLIVNPSLVSVSAKSFSFNSRAVGIYDPHPTFGDDLNDTMPISAELRAEVHGKTGNLIGRIFLGNETFPIKKRFLIINSRTFDGYAILFNNDPNSELTGLQGNIYKNGTIFLFFRDRRGGLLFIQMYNPDIPFKLSKLSIPIENIDENEWLWKLGPAVVRIKATSETTKNSMVSYNQDNLVPIVTSSSSSWISSTFITKWFEVGWWTFRTKYFITLELRVYGPPYITRSSPQMIYQAEVRINNEGTESGSGDTPLLIGDSAQVGPEAVEMGMVIPEECDRIILVSHHSASHYALRLSDVGLSFGFSLGPISLDPITAIPLVFSGGLNEDIEPTSPANAVHIEYNDMYALYPGEYIGTGEIIVNYEYQQCSGVKPFKVKFSVPVYYQLSASQGLQKVGVIEGFVYHYVNHDNTS